MDGRRQDDVSLREYVDLRVATLEQQILAMEARSAGRLAGMQREVHLITESSQTAIDKAEISTEKRFEAVNNFRAQLTDQAASFLPREVAETQTAELRKQIAYNSDRINQMTGHDNGSRQLVGWAIAGAAVFVSVASVLANVLTSH